MNLKETTPASFHFSDEFLTSEVGGVAAARRGVVRRRVVLLLAVLARAQLGPSSAADSGRGGHGTGLADGAWRAGRQGTPGGARSNGARALAASPLGG